MDKRELLLQRPVDIAQSLPGIVTVTRNQDEISEHKRPAIAVFDFDESADEAAERQDHQGRAPNLMVMTPEVLILLGASPASVGTALNEVRTKLIKSVLTDAELITLAGPNGRLRYAGCSTHLGHGRSMEGSMSVQFSKKKDMEVVTEKKMTVTMVMDEWTAENLAMALLGDVTVDVDGNKVIDIFSRNTFEGELKYEGTNEIGPQMDIDLFRVVFKPGSSLNPISDEWGNIEIEGEALADSQGKFGTWTVREQVVATP
jgi:hypothetical protein